MVPRPLEKVWLTVVVRPRPVLVIAAYHPVAGRGPLKYFTASAIGEPEDMPLKELVLSSQGKFGFVV
jgi:hypothetical protein